MTNADPHDLATRLGQEERDDLEFKANAEDCDLLRKAICTLANDLPGKGGGHLFVGVDKDGRSTRLTVDDALLLRRRADKASASAANLALGRGQESPIRATSQVVNLRDEGRVLPRPVLKVEKGVYAGADCVHVHVSASPSPPVACDGRIYVRVGPSSRRAHREEELRLSERRRAFDLPFDQRPVVGSSLAELDIELFRSISLPQ